MDARTRNRLIRHISLPHEAGGPSAATASRSCCRAAARSAPIRPASTRPCTKPASSPTGSRGVSIGAHQCGDHRRQQAASDRLQRLRTFWERITSRKIWHYTPDGDIFRAGAQCRQLMA